MRRRDALAGIAGTVGAIGVLGAGSLLLGGESGSYEPTGSVDVDGARELVTSDDGTVGYLAVDDGIATVDLSDPAAPAVLAERRGLLADDPDGPLRFLWDVSVDGDRLLAAGPANRVAGSSLHAALLYDVTDPADPRLLDTARTESQIHNCDFEDGTAYLTSYGEGGNPLLLLDASGDQLTEVGRWSLLDVEPAWADVPNGLWQLHDVVVQDDVAYLPYWDAGTYLLDVSDPSDPTHIGQTGGLDPDEIDASDVPSFQRELLALPGNDHFAQPDESGDLLAVGREAWTVRGEDACVRGGPGGIDLYDASDPANITLLATIDPPQPGDSSRQGQFTTAHNFDLRNGRCYSSWYFGGVKIHDVSDPRSPEELAWWRDPDEASFWTAQSAVPGEHFVASSAGNAGGFDDSIQGRVYVFPDRAGQQSNPPDLTATSADGESLPDC
ncbi:hypothetical protein GCM10028857_12270 [Salinarchaeum chitinilyticum]